MKLLIMSDTHGDSAVIEQVKEYVQDADIIVHCGDSELDYHHPFLQGIQRVRGNCDRQSAFPEEITEKLASGDTLFVTHGHLFNVKSTLMPLTYRAEELGATICCFGHSHVLGVEKIGNTLFINPGSLKKPRGRADKSFVVLTIHDAEYDVVCYNEQNVVLDRFTFPK